MRDIFPGYYTPTDEEFKKFWEEGIFSPDANVLLHTHRYPDQARDVLLEVIEALGDRFWVTHQAALEYQKNRPEVILEQRTKIYGNIEDALNKIEDQFASALPRHHPYLDRKVLTDTLSEAIKNIQQKIDDSRKAHPKKLSSDDLHYRLADLLKEKIGTPYSYKDLKERHTEADQRFNEEKPPGYLDRRNKKPAPDCYGDYIIWRQLIDFAKAKEKPIIFVTDDIKEDWWREHKGETLGPRPELVYEFLQSAKVAFWMYKGDQFLELAKEHLKGKTNIENDKWNEAVEVATAVRRERESSRKRKSAKVLSVSELSAVATDISLLAISERFQSDHLEQDCDGWSITAYNEDEVAFKADLELLGGEWSGGTCDDWLQELVGSERYSREDRTGVVIVCVNNKTFVRMRGILRHYGRLPFDVCLINYDAPASPNWFCED